jgi:hypothetical protein
MIENPTGDFYFTGTCTSSLGTCITDDTYSYLSKVLINSTVTATTSIDVNLTINNPVRSMSRNLRVSYFRMFGN